MDVDFDDAGIRRNFHDGNAGIRGRRVTFQQHRHFEMSSRIFDSRRQIQIVREILDRRHKHEQLAVARLDAQRRTGGPGR